MTRTRLLAALIMAPVTIAAILLLDPRWIMALCAVVFLMGLWEWFELAEIEDTLARTVLLVANLALMVAIVWASRSVAGFVLFKLASVIGVAWWLVAIIWLRAPRFASDHESWARMFKLAAAALAVIPAWCAIGWILSGTAGAPTKDFNDHLWLFTALAIVWAADSGAYFVGRKLGRHKLAPTISPNKTVEGMVGGLAAGLAIGIGGALLAGATPAQLPLVALVAVVATFASVIGDLFESLLKRQAGVKDSGHLIPGHGGILDRIDGVLAALPVFALGKDMLGF